MCLRWYILIKKAITTANRGTTTAPDNKKSNTHRLCYIYSLHRKINNTQVDNVKYIIIQYKYIIQVDNVKCCNAFLLLNRFQW